MKKPTPKVQKSKIRKARRKPLKITLCEKALHRLGNHDWDESDPPPILPHVKHFDLQTLDPKRLRAHLRACTRNPMYNLLQSIDYHRYRRIGEILMMSRHRYHKNEVLRCFSGLRTGILTRNQVTMLKSYHPHVSTEELLSSLGHIDPTATLRQLSPRLRAIEECKRVNWWCECEKMKPAGVEELSSDEEGADEADEDPAQVTVLTAEEQAAVQAERKRKALAALTQTNLEVHTLKLMAKENGHHFEIWATDGGYKAKTDTASPQWRAELKKQQSQQPHWRKNTDSGNWVHYPKQPVQTDIAGFGAVALALEDTPSTEPHTWGYHALPNKEYWGRLHLSSDAATTGQDLGAVRINQNVAEVYAIGAVMMHLLSLPVPNRPKTIAILYDSQYAYEAVTNYTNQQTLADTEQTRTEKENLHNEAIITSVQQLMKLVQTDGTTVHFVKVKGHSHHPANDIADALATEAMRTTPYCPIPAHTWGKLYNTHTEYAVHSTVDSVRHFPISSTSQPKPTGTHFPKPQIRPSIPDHYLW